MRGPTRIASRFLRRGASSASGLTTVAPTVSAAGAPGPPRPPPVSGADGGLEYEVPQELLKFKMRWGGPYVLVRWAGCDASRDTLASGDLRAPAQLVARGRTLLRLRLY